MTALAPSADAPRGAPVLIEAEGLTLSHGDRLILDKVGLAVHAGEIVSVIGPNGAGKTSLLRLLLGLARPDAGAVRLTAGVRIGYVPQRLHIDPTLPMTVRRFLLLGARAFGRNLEPIAERLSVTHMLDQQMAGLSGGETQRVLLARALMREPNLLVLDEPTQGMDVSAQAELFRLIGEIRSESGVAVIMVSHDLHLVMRGTDRVLCLNRHVCCTGLPAEVERNPSYRALFGRLDEAAVVPYRHDHDHTHDDAGNIVDGPHGHDHGHHHHHHHH